MNTAEYLIRKHLLSLLEGFNGDAVTPENVMEVYHEKHGEGLLWDIEEEFRTSGEETGLPCDFSRNYDSESVAAKIGDTWVGWTHWYGGGKHGEPGAVGWMEDAYLLDVEEKEVTVTQRTFSKRPE